MIAYIHGYNSSYDPTSDKVRALATIDGILPLSYDSWEEHDIILSQLSEAIKPYLDNKLTIVGCSCGGYYAALLAHQYGLPCVLVNPLIRPYVDFFGRAPQHNINYVTGEEYELSDITRYSYLGRYVPTAKYAYAPMVLLCADDDVLPHEQAAEAFKQYSPHIRPSGGHRYADFSAEIENIRGYIRACGFLS